MACYAELPLMLERQLWSYQSCGQQGYLAGKASSRHRSLDDRKTLDSPPHCWLLATDWKFVALAGQVVAAGSTQRVYVVVVQHVPSRLARYVYVVVVALHPLRQ